MAYDERCNLLSISVEEAEEQERLSQNLAYPNITEQLDFALNILQKISQKLI